MAVRWFRKCKVLLRKHGDLCPIPKLNEREKQLMKVAL